MPPTSPSRLAGAFESLQRAKEFAIGKREFILLNGRKVNGLVSEITIDEENVTGGIAEAGGFHVQIAQSAVAGRPEKNTAVTCRGKKLVVMSVADVNGVTWDIRIGDPAHE